MSIGSPFPDDVQTFALSNPRVTETLYNELARAIMATQRGMGADFGNLAKEWGAKKEDVKTVLDKRLLVDAGQFLVADAGTPPITSTISEAVTFRSPTPFTDADEIRVFATTMNNRQYNDAGAGTIPLGFSNCVITSVTTSGFTYKWIVEPNNSDTFSPRVAWFAVQGWDYW